MQKHNFHTHSTYSDGKFTLREMTEAAIQLGFDALGFSDHSYARGEEDYCMTLCSTEENYAEIRALAEEYRGKIRLFAGLELDCESPDFESDYDYIIASVHEIVDAKSGRILQIDASAEEQCELVNTFFGGSFVDFSRAYYEKVTEHVVRHKPEIVGHFDLLTKFSLAPESDERYMDAAREAVKECVKYCGAFEVNTGAIARKRRTTPYPAPFILDEIKSCGGVVILTSDCHHRDYLTCFFSESEQILREHGFTPDEHGRLNDKITDIRLWY